MLGEVLLRPERDGSLAEASLRAHAVDGEDVLSWVNPDHEGYAYPEAAGLLLRWLAQGDRPVPPRVRARLVALVEANTVGRDGTTYQFDTGVVLAGLESLDTTEDPRWTAARQRLQHMPVTSPGAKPRWSSVRGPHLLKLAVGSAARAARGWSTPAVEFIASVPADQDSTGRLQTPPHEASYVHAHAYATEGILALRSLGLETAASVDGCIAFLRAAQREDGSLPAWSDGGPSRADSTAQAIRLWVLHDRTEHADAIARGLSFLDTVTDADGLVRYEPNSADRNTWCTLFAAQARSWAAGATARVEDLL